MRRLAWFFVSVTACSPSPGAGDGGSTGSEGGTSCSPGMSVGCVCTNGAMGAQVCDADGSGYGACECEGSSLSSNSADTTATVDPDVTSNDATATLGDSSSGSGAESGSSESTGGTIDLDGWTFRAPITITNDLPDDLDDFQVMILVAGNGNLQGDFDDLRFTADDGMTGIPHWIEYTTVPVEAAAWVRVPNIPGDGSVQLWMYYGNPDAPSASDEATMFFAEDFEDDMLDATKWGATDQYALANGVLTVESGALYSQDAVIGEGQMLQVRAQSTCCEGSEPSNIMSAQAQDMSINYAYLRAIGDSLLVQYSDGMTGGPNTNVMLGYLNMNNFADLALARTAGQAHFRYWLPPNTFSYALDADDDHYVVLGYYLGASSGTMELRPMNFEAAFVRRFAFQEPTVEIGAEEAWP